MENEAFLITLRKEIEFCCLFISAFFLSFHQAFFSSLLLLPKNEFLKWSFQFLEIKAILIYMQHQTMKTKEKFSAIAFDE